MGGFIQRTQQTEQSGAERLTNGTFDKLDKPFIKPFVNRPKPSVIERFTG